MIDHYADKLCVSIFQIPASNDENMASYEKYISSNLNYMINSTSTIKYDL